MFTQEQRDELAAAIAKGARRLRMGAMEVEFRSLAEMEGLLARMDDSLSGGTRGSFGVTYPVTRRGL